jgi:hypothetical protein
MTIRKIVGVWYDETPEAEHRAWVVADEEMDGDETLYTTTVAAFDTLEEAREAGEARAAKRGVPCEVQMNARTHGN